MLEETELIILGKKMVQWLLNKRKWNRW
uniref:Uncharacterized protein n=1 Tax=Arundo donax TaxID=35708 RepID=A0A0A8ZZ21_ARUDO